MGWDYSTEISDTWKGKRPRVSHVRESVVL